mgnify:CR=1 FL=1
MATRARIGLMLDDGSVISCYSHWDNYPEGAGKILTTEYDTREKAEELIDGGDISSLRTNRDWNGVETESARVLYYSERGEEGTEPQHSDTLGDFICTTRECWGEFAYVFDLEPNKWVCYNMYDSQEVNLYETSN